MAHAKSEQLILTAFESQRQRGEANPVYVADGKRMIQAAQSLCEKGLARVTRREVLERKTRGKVITRLFVSVEPVTEKVAGRKRRPAGEKAAASSNAEHPWIGDLRIAVRSSKLSDRELAKRSGVSQPVISRFRNGTRGISFENGARLGVELGFRFIR
jgi:hypothetical protein